MGNNQAGRDFQQMIVGLHDLHKLDIETLDLVGKTFYYYSDIDSGGYDYNLLTRDGLTVEQVVLQLLDPDFIPEDSDDEFYRFDEITKSRWQSDDESGG